MFHNRAAGSADGIFCGNRPTPPAHEKSYPVKGLVLELGDVPGRNHHVQARGRMFGTAVEFYGILAGARLSLAGKRFGPYSRVALTSVTSFELRSANRIREVGNGKNHTA